MDNKSNKYLIAALLIGIAFHGTSIFFTLESTYDAYIHLFFGEHYANSWFEPWNYKWYTGFTVMGYPPLIHQSIGALSYIGGLKFGLYTVALISIVLFITGVYRFALLLTGHRKVAGYAAILAVFSSSFVETLHLFGQLPSIIGISVLMHSLTEIYLWLKTGKKWYLITAISLIALTVTSHHVTPIFGMVFFIFPLIGMVIMDHSKEKVGTTKKITFLVFYRSFLHLFKRIISFGLLSLATIILCILPYWINSKNNPITQVPIPHGSRDNFLEITSSGLVFFLIPWGIIFLILPYIFYRFYEKRYLFFGLSFTILFILGTGGTTPIPRALLGETAFNILTLDRFTLWASIMALPIFGEFVYRLVETDLKTRIQEKFGAIYHRLLGGFLAVLFLFMTVFTITLSYFKPPQPPAIKMLPILNFLSADQHDQWRFITLGFGDQMAWLSAQTNAMSVDGNYHSARRLPELTTRPVERLENSKFKGVEGLGSLQQFLTRPEKYSLKYIFSNDKFYDPILFFSGWKRLIQLENGIMVWEKLNVAPISKVVPKQDVAKWQKILWGIVPFSTVLLAFILNIQMLWIRVLKKRPIKKHNYLNLKKEYTLFPKLILKLFHIWLLITGLVVLFGFYYFYIKNEDHYSPENAVLAYYDALDFKNFEKAYSLINPKSNLTMSQYMLETSVVDGLLSSYAKLDAITTKTISKNDSLASLKINTQWVTPLEKATIVSYRNLIKVNNKWYLQPEDIDLDIPPDRLIENISTNYFNQGRRKITTEQTYHEDKLRQPVLEVLSAKLVQYKNQYAIVGEIQNIDNAPTNILLKGTLYNNNDVELATFNAKHHVKHQLMAKETTSFRINFEGIAWSNSQDSIPSTFNPEEFTPLKLEDTPTKFNLHLAAHLSGAGLYKQTAIQVTDIDQEYVSGNLFNAGTQEVTIPQLLVSYYNEKKELVWVDHLFTKKGVRQQRRLDFKYPILNEAAPLIINNDSSNCFVNGLPNSYTAKKEKIETDTNPVTSDLQKIDSPYFSFIKFEITNYIGNPN